MDQPTVYYAHPMTWYGTKAEKADMQAIAKRWPKAKIINPAMLEAEVEAYKKHNGRDKVMEFFANLIRDKVDIVVVRPAKKKLLSGGVAREAFEAHNHDKGLYVFNKDDNSDEIDEISLASLFFWWRVMPLAETREWLERKVL